WLAPGFQFVQLPEPARDLRKIIHGHASTIRIGQADCDGEIRDAELLANQPLLAFQMRIEHGSASAPLPDGFFHHRLIDRPDIEALLDDVLEIERSAGLRKML